MGLNKRFAELAGIEYGHKWEYVTFSTHHGWESPAYRCRLCGKEIKDYKDEAEYKGKIIIIPSLKGDQCSKSPDFSSPIEVLRVMKAREDWFTFCASFNTYDFAMMVDTYLLTPGALRDRAIEYLTNKKGE